MKRVKYTGHKVQGISVHLPIGCKQKSAFKGVISFTPFADMQDEDAEKLIELDPQNFKFVTSDDGTADEILPVKKRGRPAKKTEVEIGQ